MFVAALLGSALAGAACGQAKKPDGQPAPKPDAQPAPKPAAPKLGVGDVAPPLKVTKWLQGEEVKTFAKDKVYVVEFWATWCGPCIAAMPHLNDLHTEYKAKGLEVIGLTSKDPNNSRMAVEEFVAKNGKKFTYRFAYCDDRDTDKAYMEAAGQDGIPCSFVVGKDGKIAYIGHPMELDDVLPLILDGKWEGKKSMDALNAKKKELEDILQTVGEAEQKKTFNAEFAGKTLEKLAAYEKKHPDMALKADVTVPKLVLSLKAGQFDNAAAICNGVLAAAEATKKARGAFLVGMILSDKELNPDKKLMDVAVKGADLALKLDGTNMQYAINAIDVYLNAGNKEAAVAAGKRAVAAASDEQKKEVTAIVEKKLAGEKKK